MTDSARHNHPDLWRASMPRLSPDTHKYERGHALIVGGYPMTGAARLAARAAARMGAGLTTVAVPQVAFPIYAASLTSVMVHPLAAVDGLANLLAERRFSALLIGPGAGVGAQTCTDTLAVLGAGRPTLLDAGALTSFSGNAEPLFAAIAGDCVMTPHEGEFARLFGNAGTRAERAAIAARRSGAIVVLKGRETIVAAPDGRVIVNGNAPPTLATAGSGDVLSGMIVGLLAQGVEPFAAAAAATWMHGAAAASFGPGLIADDLPDLIPPILQQLGQHGAD